MRRYAVLTATGPDRKGLVAELTEFLLKYGANIEDSRMAVLGGDFAVILLFSASGRDLEAVLENKEKIEKEIAERTGLNVFIRPTSSRPSRAEEGLIWNIHAVALDHPGIVHRLAQAIADKGINILELRSAISPAPVSAAPLFSLFMKVNVPKGLKPASLRESLSKLADEMGVDLEVRPEP